MHNNILCSNRTILLIVLYSHLSRRSRIIRSNWTYLVDTLKETGEMVKPPLRLTDCLSDVQMRSFNRIKDHRQKTAAVKRTLQIFKYSRPTVQYSRPTAVTYKHIKAVFVVFISALSPTVIRLQKRLEETSYVHGIVRLNDSLYVLCHQPNAVRVYECNDDDAFPFQRQILLQLIVQPWDIAASSRSNCLYVTDSHNRCVWKIKESCGSQVAKWLHDASSLQFTLSVTSNGQVLLVTGGAPRLSLELYTPDAELARSIRLPGHVFSPVHAVVTTSGNFVVIYGWWNSKRWGICKLNSEGETVRQFRPMNDSQQLNCPWHLALDEDDGVFVADYENNRVIVLDSDLSWVKILLSQDNDGLTEPWRLLYYAGSRKLLVVAHLHKVDVYALTQT